MPRIVDFIVINEGVAKNRHNYLRYLRNLRENPQRPWISRNET